MNKNRNRHRRAPREPKKAFSVSKATRELEELNRVGLHYPRPGSWAIAGPDLDESQGITEATQVRFIRGEGGSFGGSGLRVPLLRFN